LISFLVPKVRPTSGPAPKVTGNFKVPNTVQASKANVAKVPQEIITADKQICKVPAALTVKVVQPNEGSPRATGAGDLGYLFVTCNKFKLISFSF